MPMKLEARSVSVVWENNAIKWTPYRIGERPDGQVRVTPYFKAPIADFSQDEFTLLLPYEKKPVFLTRIAPDQYDVGGAGILRIYDDACTYTSDDKKIIFTARIPSAERKDAICTGLALLGALMRTAGLGH